MEILPQLERDYGPGGKIYIVAHEFPLNIPAHKYNREAANYATAAARIGRYDAVADKLFLNQASWDALHGNPSGKVWETVASVLTPAEQKKVLALSKDPSVLAEVESDVDLGNRMGVNSTPTVFVTYGMRRFPLPNVMNYTASPVVARWHQVSSSVSRCWPCALRSASFSYTPRGPSCATRGSSLL